MIKNVLVIFVPLFLTYILFSFTQIELFNDYFSLGKISSSKDLISTILGTLATIISITFVVIVLSFETFKQKAGENAIEYFSKIKWLHYLITIYITSILLIFFSLIEVSKDTLKTLNLVYFNIYVFIITLILVSYFSYKLLQSISLSPLIAYYFSICDLNIENISKKSIEEKIKNPWFILEDLGLSYLRKGDFVIANFIYEELTNKIVEGIVKSNENDKIRGYLHFLSSIYTNAIPEAINKSNNKLLFDFYFHHYNIHSAINKEHKIIFWEHYLSFGYSYYEKLILSNRYDIAEANFEVASFLFFQYDKKMLFEEEKTILSFFHSYKEAYIKLYGEVQLNDQIDNSENWSCFINLYKDIYYKCCEFNQRNYDEIALRKVLYYMCEHIPFNDYSDEPLKKIYQFKVFYPLISEFLIRASDKEIFKHDLDEIIIYLNPLRRLSTDSGIFYEPSILTDYCILLTALQKHNFIEYYIVGGLRINTLILPGEIGTLIFRYLEKHEDETMLDCLSVVVETIGVLKNGFEKDLFFKKNSALHYQLRERLIEISTQLTEKKILLPKAKKILLKVNNLIFEMNHTRKDIDKNYLSSFS